MDEEKLVTTKAYTCGGINFTRRELGFAIVTAVALCLLIVSATLFGIGIGRKDSNTTSTHVLQPHECIEPQCLESTASLQFLRNSSVDPCDNFYAYACASSVWNENRLADNQIEFSEYHQLMELNLERLRSSLGSASKRTVAWAAELKVKDFYESCLDTYGNSKNGSRFFLDQILTPSGGWNAIGTWNEATYSLTDAIKKVHIDYWRNSLFTVHVGTDWEDPKRNVLEVEYHH